MLCDTTSRSRVEAAAQRIKLPLTWIALNSCILLSASIFTAS